MSVVQSRVPHIEHYYALVRNDPTLKSMDKMSPKFLLASRRFAEEWDQVREEVCKELGF